MTVKITARFPDTESADATLARISESVKNIYEARIYYDTESEGRGIANNILYYTGNILFEYTPVASQSYPFELDRTDKLLGECFVNIVCDGSDTDDVRKLIYNGGGFDVSVF